MGGLFDSGPDQHITNALSNMASEYDRQQAQARMGQSAQSARGFQNQATSGWQNQAQRSFQDQLRQSLQNQLRSSLQNQLQQGLTDQTRTGQQTQTGTQVQRTEVAPWLSDAMQGALGRAENIFQQGAPLASPYVPQLGADTLASLDMTRQLAGGPNPARGAMDYNDAVLRGDYLAGGPAFDAAFQAASNRIIPQVQGTFSGAGRLNSGLAQTAMAGQLGDAFAGLYGQERARQQQAAQMAPTMANLAYDPARRLAGVGSVMDAQEAARQQAAYADQFAPQQSFDNYLRALTGISAMAPRTVTGETMGDVATTDALTGMTTDQRTGMTTDQLTNQIMDQLMGETSGTSIGSQAGTSATMTGEDLSRIFSEAMSGTQSGTASQTQEGQQMQPVYDNTLGSILGGTAAAAPLLFGGAPFAAGGAGLLGLLGIL